MIKIKDIKKGDVFYECEYGKNMQFLALTDAYEQDEGWAVKGQGIHGEIEFYSNSKYPAYHPKLYREAQY